MPKKNQIKPDTILKNYWRDNAQFADLFNAVLFGGAQVIRPDELEDDDTEDSTVMEHRDIAESIETFRDNIKIRKVSNASGIQFVLLGLEHQEHIHYAMPMRIMGYDYSVYKKQYDKNAANYTTSVGMQEDEYLSRMKKTDKLVPVITILVYYGEKTWDGAVTLHEMLHIPTAWRPFVNDYKLLLVEAKKNDLKLHNINNIDLFNMLELLGDKKSTHKETKEKAIAYAKEHHVDRSVLMAVAGAANCRIDYNLLGRKGEADMWAVFEETRKEGKAEGKAEGILEGRAVEIIESGLEYGLPEPDVIERLQRKLKIPAGKAKEYFRQYGKAVL